MVILYLLFGNMDFLPYTCNRLSEKKMKIISKGNKDYYDYLMGVYGQDELVVYDRRNCFPIDPTKKWGDDVDRAYPSTSSDYLNINIEMWFRKEVMYRDKPRKEIRKYNTYKVLVREEWDKERTHRKNGIVDKILEGDVYHFVLEVGYKHYIFEVERYVDDNDANKLHLEYSLIKVMDVAKEDRLSKAPMSLCPISDHGHYGVWTNKLKVTETDKNQIIENPILYSTYIPKFIPAEEMWNLLYEYISSLRDKEFTDNRTDVEHIESHGFDKKISFRHRK